MQGKERLLFHVPQQKGRSFVYVANFDWTAKPAGRSKRAKHGACPPFCTDRSADYAQRALSTLEFVWPQCPT
eukprot:1156584-Pelagomonas_calceolata.AAC.8